MTYVATATGVNDAPTVVAHVGAHETGEGVDFALDRDQFISHFRDVDDDPDDSGDSFAGVIITRIDNGSLTGGSNIGDVIQADQLAAHAITPDDDFEGVITVTFRLVDRHGAESAGTGTMTITVTAALDPSTAAPTNTPRGGGLPGHAANPDNPVAGIFIPSDPDPDDDKTNIGVKIHSRTRRVDDVDGQPGPDGAPGAPDVTLLGDPGAGYERQASAAGQARSGKRCRRRSSCRFCHCR